MSHLEIFREELDRLSVSVYGVIVLGDLNIHHRKWLRFSNRDTPEGEYLKSVCDDHDLRQIVDKPTRGQYLLDLCLTNLDRCKATVVNKIADHCGISLSVPLPIPIVKKIPRQVWHLRNAKWDHLKCELRAIDWQILSQGDVDSATELFVQILLGLCKTYIPYGEIMEKKASHPWLDDVCIAAIQRKNQAEGTSTYESAAESCTRIIAESHRRYLVSLRARIEILPRNSKRWWKLNRELLHRKTQISSIPPLRTTDGRWLTDSKNKADLFADVWSSKSTLPEEIDDPFIAPPRSSGKSDFHCPYTRDRT